MRISLASPHDIRSWSFGEVKKPETINYRTYRPEKDGLFCERIFGPEKDWECACGKYRGMKYKGMICDRCGVKVTHSRVRRKRMGHIELAAPVVHIWFFKAMPSRLGTLLDMKTTSLEKIIYFQDYVVVDPGDTPLKEQQLLTEDEYRKARESYGDTLRSRHGRRGRQEAARRARPRRPVAASCARSSTTESQKDKPSKQKLRDLVKRLKVVEALRDSAAWAARRTSRSGWCWSASRSSRPTCGRWCCSISGNFATSDLNDLYRRIINRNNRLKKLVDLNAPEVIIRNEKRMLQQSVDALFDNNRCKRPVLGSQQPPAQVADRHDQGQAGPLPRKPARQARRLLGPLGHRRRPGTASCTSAVCPRRSPWNCSSRSSSAGSRNWATPTRSSRPRRCSNARTTQVWDILEEVIKNHPVLLNRAPTLHRMGIQAFEPVLIEGNAIRIHPLVCKGFNADFDGDQMAVHLPLSIEAQVEATVLMMSTNNIFSPANGQPIISPSQDIVMGCYYLTATRGEPGENDRGRRGHDLRQPRRGLHGLRPEEARRPRPHPGAAADREEGHQRGPLRQGQDPASRKCRASPTAWCPPPSAG